MKTQVACNYSLFLVLLFCGIPSILSCKQLNKIALDNEMQNIDLNHNALKIKSPNEYRSLNLLSKHIIAEDKKSLDFYTSKVVWNICLIVGGTFTFLTLTSCLALVAWKVIQKFRTMKHLLESQSKERKNDTAWKAI